MTRPTIQEIPFTPDSESLFARFRHLPGAVWLDSGKPRSLQGRFDLISALPEVTIRSTPEKTIIQNGGDVEEASGDPFSLAWEQLESRGLFGRDYAHIPFCGGLIGYFSYDLGERLLQVRRDGAPANTQLHLGWYGWALVTNHQSAKTWLIIHPQCRTETLEQVQSLLRQGKSPETDEHFSLIHPFRPQLSQNEYIDAVLRIKEYIRSGDCYQANFALRHHADFEGDLWIAYRRLRRASPAPYSAYLQWGDRTLLSFSPERFLKVSVGQVETKPIKGTIPRGVTLEKDQDNAVQLLNSKKDRAENLMIVDLLRNDLGINCATGSIRVPKLFALESFANVHHLVSTITGTLGANRTPLDLLRDAFPGGSITGAPKKRAMEIIAGLERIPRGVYCGSVGYISANGRMDTNIAIRTLEARDGELVCWGGGGIVDDSDPETEYREALHKVDNLMRGLESL